MLKSAKSLNIKYYTLYCCISPVRLQKLTPAASLPFSAALYETNIESGISPDTSGSRWKL